MPSDMLFALAAYAIVTSITPGPNNFMLLASGVNFGFARTVPHMAGIGFGFFSLLFGVGIGLGSLLIAYPEVEMTLKALGAAYMLYLAWKIGSSRSMGSGVESAERPMGFAAAALFQWVNPKGWAMALTAVSLYADPTQPFRSVLLLAALFCVVGVPCLAVWTVFGVTLRRFLSDPVRLKRFNIAMALLLVASLWPMLS